MLLNEICSALNWIIKLYIFVVAFYLGNDSSPVGKFVDDEKNVMIIPNPSSPIQADGSLVEWKIYAVKPGHINLDVSKRFRALFSLFHWFCLRFVDKFEYAMENRNVETVKKNYCCCFTISINLLQHCLLCCFQFDILFNVSWWNW